MKSYLIGGTDLHGIDEGESFVLAIPGSVDGVFTWIQNQAQQYIDWFTTPNIFSSQILLAAKKDNQIAVVFTNFSPVEEKSDTRCTFETIYHPDYKRLAFEILSSAGTAFGAEWQLVIKKDLDKIPPLRYKEWIEKPGPFPGSTQQALVWHEGPPPGWEPPANQPGKPETAQGKNPLESILAVIKSANELTRLQEKLMRGNPYLRPVDGLTPGMDNPTVNAPATQEVTAGKYDELCKKWVNRPSVPYRNKSEFLGENAPELLSKSFDRILSEAHNRGVIDRTPGKHGRYKPKI